MELNHNTINPNLNPYETGQISPGNGLNSKDAEIATNKLDMEAEDNANEFEIKKDDEKNKNELTEKINGMILSYQNKMSETNYTKKEKTLDAIANDVNLITISAKNSHLEDDDEVKKLIAKLNSIKEFIENSR